MSGRDMVRRAHAALRSRVNQGRTPTDVWPIGLVKQLDPNDVAHQAGDHDWGTEYPFSDGIVLCGCRTCSAVRRVTPAPDPRDRDALERWLNS